MTKNRERERNVDETHGIPRIVLIGALALVLALAAITLARHTLFLSTTYDMAFYVHAVSQISAGEWVNTLFGFHVFADHFSPILIVLAPLGWAAPAEGLLIVQAVAVGSGIIPAYRIGRAVAGDRVGGLAAMWYGFSATVWHTVLYDFRPATLGVVAMLWLIAELETLERPLVISCVALVAAASREDVAVLTGLAILLHAFYRRRWHLALAGVGIAAVGVWFTTVGHRLFAPFEYFLWYRYADYGHSPGDVLSGLDYAIPTFVERTVRAEPLIALAAFTLPPLIIPVIRGWKRSWPALAIFLANAASADPLVASIHYQYYLAAVVFVIWGAVYGFRTEWAQNRVRLSQISALSVFVVLGPLGLFLAAPEGRSLTSIVSRPERAAIGEVLSAIPDDASISAGDFLLPHLADRSDIKPYPGPLTCSPTLLSHYPATSHPDFIVVEPHDLDQADIDLEAEGYFLESNEEVMVWHSSGRHPEPMTCPSVEEARRGLFVRVEGLAGK